MKMDFNGCCFELNIRLFQLYEAILMIWNWCHSFPPPIFKSSYKCFSITKRLITWQCAYVFKCKLIVEWILLGGKPAKSFSKCITTLAISFHDGEKIVIILKSLNKGMWLFCTFIWLLATKIWFDETQVQVQERMLKLFLLFWWN